MINTTAGFSHVRDFNGGNRYNQQCHLCAAENLASRDILNFSVSSPLPIRKWWNGYVNTWYNYQMFDGKIGENKVNVNIPSYGAYRQHSFTLGKDYTAEVSGWFNGPSVGRTWRTKSQGAIDLACRSNCSTGRQPSKCRLPIFFTQRSGKPPMILAASISVVAATGKARRSA